MAGTVPGLSSASGIDTAAVIDSIMNQRARRITQIEDRIGKAEDEKRAFLDVNARLLSLQEVSRRLANGTSFTGSLIRSSNEAALLATGDSSSVEGTFQFHTHSLASSSQYVSTGFTDVSSTKVSATAGKLSIEVGDARVSRPTSLDFLNGGKGIDRGKLRISDDAGNTAVIDLSTAVTIHDVIERINNNGVALVNARVNDLQGTGLVGDSIVIENSSGAGNLRVEDVGTGKTATSLGIAGISGTGQIVGTQVNTLGRATQLSEINDGRGFGDGSGQALTATIVDSTGSWNVDFGKAATIGDIIDIINNSGAAARASIAADGRSLQLVDPSPPFSVNISGPGRVVDTLGFSGGAMINDPPTGTRIGGPLIGSMNSVLMGSLGGMTGAGFTGSIASPGSFDITDSNGVTTTVTFTGREDLFQLMNQINNPLFPGADVEARLDESGTGLEIIDRAGGPLDMVIADVGAGTIASEMGIAGTFAEGATGESNLNFRWMHGNRLLSDFGFDAGFLDGRMEVTQKNGSIANIDISLVKTLGQLVRAMNQLPTLSFDINTRGDGFRINDTSGGTGSLSIQDKTGTFARKLGLRGTFTGPSLFEQRREYEIDVSTSDTLNSIMDKIRGLEVPVVATALNDGSSDKPFRLSITGTQSGMRNDVIVRTDISQLQFRQTAAASDALLLYGSTAGNSDPVVLQSRNNTFKNVIPGVTLDLQSIVAGPISVTVQRDLQAAANDISEMVDSFNSLAGRLKEVAGFDVETLTGGPLLGNSTLSGLQNSLVASLLNPVDGLPLGSNTLARYGIDIESDGTFTVDNDRLQESLETKLAEVRDLFGNSARLQPETKLTNWNSGQGIKQTDGEDLMFSFADGSADLMIDLSSYDEMRQLLAALNADGRLEVTISNDSKRLVFRDLTTGAGTFKVQDLNNSGTLSSLGLRRSEALPGEDRIETKDISLNTELGVGRRVDSIVTRYTQTDGLIEEATDSIDERIKRFNEDIEKVTERIEAERERLERQFQAMEVALAESKSASDTLKSTLQAQQKNKE